MPPSRTGVAFLLAQLGQQATERFAARLAELDLVPPQAGILRVIATEPGRSQQALAERLQLFPSRMVAFIDELTERGLIERRRSTQDRRLNALFLTDKGKAVLEQVAAVGQAHEAEFTTGLTAGQRATLSELLGLIAAGQGLSPGIHPGYRSIGRNRSSG